MLLQRISCGEKSNINKEIVKKLLKTRTYLFITEFIPHIDFGRYLRPGPDFKIDVVHTSGNHRVPTLILNGTTLKVRYSNSGCHGPKKGPIILFVICVEAAVVRRHMGVRRSRGHAEGRLLKCASSWNNKFDLITGWVGGGLNLTGARECDKRWENVSLWRERTSTWAGVCLLWRTCGGGSVWVVGDTSKVLWAMERISIWKLERGVVGVNFKANTVQWVSH